MHRVAAACLGLSVIACGCMGPAPGVLFDPAKDYPTGPKPRPVALRPHSSSVPNSWCAARTRSQWRYVVIHHSATECGCAAKFDANHRARIDYVNGLGYHFVIGNGSDTPDGCVEVGRRWKRQIRGAHCGVDYYNCHGIGVCLVGNFETHPPSRRQMASLEKLVRFLQARYSIPTNAVVGHRHIKGTLCPGRYFPYRRLLASLNAPAGGRLAAAPTYLGK